MAPDQSQSKKSFFADLWDRRFFQFLATYIAGSWGLIQFTEWGVRRYGIPSEWVDKLVLMLLLLLPSVISLIYLHGRSGADRWWKFEKIMYPANVVIALLASVLLVGSSAQTTEQVEITTDEGETVVREIPKAEFTKRIALFPFENENGRDPSWKSIGIAILLDMKLEQDMRIMGISPLSFNEAYINYNYDVYNKIPFSTKKNIAGDYYTDFFVDGMFIDAEETKLEVIIYSTDDGSEVANQVIESSNPIQLAEKVSEFVSSRIKLMPVEGQEKMVDLPASNLITADTIAFRHYVQSAILMEKDATQTKEAISIMEKATEIDPTCTQCYSVLGNLYLLDGRDSRVPMKEAMKYVDNVSERQQLYIKYYNYISNEEPEKALRLLQTWRKLYPLDSKAVDLLVNNYERTLRVKEAQAEVEKAIEEGHKGHLYLKYANMLISQKEWDKAEKYLKKYQETYPKQAESTMLLANTYAAQGKIDKALETLDELSLMHPNEMKYDLKKVSILNTQNEFTKAHALADRLLRNANSKSDTMDVYKKKMEVYARQGKVTDYYKVFRKLKKTFLTKYPPIAFLQTEYSTAGMYQSIDAIDTIEINVRKYENLVPPIQRPIIKNLNDFIISTFAEDREEMVVQFDKVKGYLQASVGDDVLKIYQAELAYLNEDYVAAQTYWKELIESIGNMDLISQNYFESYVKSGNYAEGLEVVNEKLESDPKSSLHLLVKAKLLAKLGKSEEAIAALDEAWSVLQYADEKFRYRKEAEVLRTELSTL